MATDTSTTIDSTAANEVELLTAHNPHIMRARGLLFGCGLGALMWAGIIWAITQVLD